MNNEPVLVSEADVSYMIQQLQAYTDNAVAEAEQTSVLRSGSKWKDLVDAINAMLGTSFGYDADLDDITDALSAYESNTLPAGIVLWDGSTAASIVDILQHPENVKSISLPTVGNFQYDIFLQLEYLNLPNYNTTLKKVPTTIKEINLPRSTGSISNCFYNCYFIERIELPNVSIISSNSEFANCTSLEVIKVPKWNGYFGSSSFIGCSNLKQIYAPMAWGINANNTLNNVVSLRDLTISRMWGGATPYPVPSLELYRIHFTSPVTASLNLSNWNPTTAVNATRDDLVPQEEWDLERDGVTPVDCTGFSNNQEKFLYFFKNVFMPSFATVITTQTLSLKSTIYDVIINDTDITDYFSSNGWTLARVA